LKSVGRQLNTLYDASILEMEFNDATLPTGRLCVVFCLSSATASLKPKERDMHRTIRRRPLFALFVSFTVITLGVLLNACQSSEARPSSALVIATARPRTTSTVTVAPSPDTPDQAATRFLRAFYTADYRHQDRWLAALQPLASADGYSLLENLIAPALWKDLSAAQTVVTADQVTVDDGGLTAEGVSKLVGNTPWQIRQVTVTLASDAKWPGWTTSTYATNILLSHEPDGWKFVMLLSADQAKVFQAKPQGDH
jgi:hypothetical protein